MKLLKRLVEMIILEDTRQQDQKHTTKHKWFAENGVEIRRTKLYVGDYTLPTNQSICIDTKASIDECISNICGKQHERFRSELIRAQEAGIQLIILVENRGARISGTNFVNPTIRHLDDLETWVNPRLCIFKGNKQLYPTATKGKTLMKACMTLEKRYGVVFRFCTPEESGAEIVRLLQQ